MSTVKIGYKLSSEERTPLDLVRDAERAEEAGFSFALISDHYHPWTDRQGQSPFVWSVLGAIAKGTKRLEVGTGVTCPTVRMHPAIVAQAAATAAALMPGRFFLGLGTGENLNEHIIGRGWPSTSVRQERLEEAIEIIRRLFTGENVEHRGRHFTVENARLYGVPPQPPRIMIAVGGPKSAEIAGRLGDGLIGTSPKADSIRQFEQAGGRGKPRYGEVTVCWAEKAADARRIAREVWPIAALGSGLAWELPLPRHFESAAEPLTEDQVAEYVVCGPDPERHLEVIRTYVDAGYDHICIHQVGPDQEGFVRFYRERVLTQLGRLRRAA
jgi:coenzyme F420-dependent glucose-6-phosphate dehydrogenase